MNRHWPFILTIENRVTVVKGYEVEQNIESYI